MEIKECTGILIRTNKNYVVSLGIFYGAVLNIAKVIQFGSMQINQEVKHSKRE